MSKFEIRTLKSMTPPRGSPLSLLQVSLAVFFRLIPLHERLMLYEVIGLGFVGGLATTYTALSNILSPDFIKKPCYL